MLQSIPIEWSGDAVDEIVDRWHRQRPDWDMVALTLWVRGRDASDSIVMVANAHLKPQGLSLADFEILAIIERFGEPFCISQHDLVPRSRRSHGTLSLRLRHLAALDLIRTEHNPHDLRRSIVSLTQRGHALFGQVIDDYVEFHMELAESLEPEERSELTRLLRKFQAGLDRAKAGCAASQR